MINIFLRLEKLWQVWLIASLVEEIFFKTGLMRYYGFCGLLFYTGVVTYKDRHDSAVLYMSVAVIRFIAGIVLH